MSLYFHLYSPIIYVRIYLVYAHCTNNEYIHLTYLLIFIYAYVLYIHLIYDSISLSNKSLIN